jgi:hypothetical protein
MAVDYVSYNYIIQKNVAGVNHQRVLSSTMATFSLFVYGSKTISGDILGTLSDGQVPLASTKICDTYHL